MHDGSEPWSSHIALTLADTSGGGEDSIGGRGGEAGSPSPSPSPPPPVSSPPPDVVDTGGGDGGGGGLGTGGGGDSEGMAAGTAPTAGVASLLVCILWGGDDEGEGSGRHGRINGFAVGGDLLHGEGGAAGTSTLQHWDLVRAWAAGRR